MCWILPLLLETHDVLVGNFPAEVLLLALLFEMLLQKDGPAGIGHKGARGGQKNIAGAILHLDFAP